jgi:hypothetical protein
LPKGGSPARRGCKKQATDIDGSIRINSFDAEDNRRSKQPYRADASSEEESNKTKSSIRLERVGQISKSKLIKVHRNSLSIARIIVTQTNRRRLSSHEIIIMLNMERIIIAKNLNMEKEEKKYVFNEVEDVNKLEGTELRRYAVELQERLAESKKSAKNLQDWWYAERMKVEHIKEDMETLKKITNLMVEKW